MNERRFSQIARRFSQIVVLLSVICLMASFAQAEVPRLINYQGKLTDKDGAPLEGAHNITFRIYDAHTAGNLLWQETHANLIIENGILGVLLGSVTTLNLDFGQPYWLAIKVGEDAEMSPRQQIASVGYALKAQTAFDSDTVDGKQAADFIEQNSPAGGDLTGTYPNPTIITTIPKNMQVFTSSGTWIKPPHINKVYVKVWGGGGQGENSRGEGGGGGGAYAEGLIAVTGDAIVTVGAGGTGGSETGGDGGTSSFAGTTTIQAGGGKGGYQKGGGEGGIASGGAINLNGQAGTGRDDDGIEEGWGGDCPMGGSGGYIVCPGHFPGGGSGSGKATVTNSAYNGAAGLVIVYY